MGISLLSIENTYISCCILTNGFRDYSFFFRCYIKVSIVNSNCYRPAYKVRGKVMFSVCLPGGGEGIPLSRSWLGEYPSQVPEQRYISPLIPSPSPSPRTAHIMDRIHCGWYASCGYAGGIPCLMRTLWSYFVFVCAPFVSPYVLQKHTVFNLFELSSQRRKDIFKTDRKLFRNNTIDTTWKTVSFGIYSFNGNPGSDLNLLLLNGEVSKDEDTESRNTV